VKEARVFKAIRACGKEIWLHRSFVPLEKTEKLNSWPLVRLERKVLGYLTQEYAVYIEFKAIDAIDRRKNKVLQLLYFSTLH